MLYDRAQCYCPIEHCCAVRFSDEVKETEEPFAACTEAGERRSTSDSVEGIDLGLLKPERTYEASICPVDQGTEVCNFSCEGESLSVSIHPASSGDTAVATCQLDTPQSGSFRHSFAVDFVDEQGGVKHREFELAGQVVTADKGKPVERSFVRCISSKSRGSSTDGGY
jgi:hypothetical protein